MNEKEEKSLLKDEFYKSRDGAIIRCTSIVAKAGRNDLAKQILLTTKVDRRRFEEIKAQNS